MSKLNRIEKVGTCLALTSVIAILAVVASQPVAPQTTDIDSNPGQLILDTLPTVEGRVTVGNETFTFDPTEVVTTRPDIFNHGYFSMLTSWFT